MFRNRQSSQKPPDELFERFRQSFSSVIATTTSPSSQAETAVANGMTEPTFHLPKQTNNAAGFSNGEDLDPTPRAPADPFRFTPSLTPSAFMDPTSAAFAAFANQPPGLFTPTPGGNMANGFNASNPISNAIAAAHDLQASNIGISIEAPVSNGSRLQAPSSVDTARLNATQTAHPFHNYQPFSHPLHPQFLDQSQYNPQPPSGPGSPMDVSGDNDMMADALNGSLNELTSLSTTIAPPMPLDEKQFSHISQLLPSSERFRFNVVLNAPTAMIKHPDEIPVTYLNKGQAYAISIADNQASRHGPPPVKYRTYIRISFHDETQRSRAMACWQLWKEGRGLNEAHQRGGKLQAVEYVASQINEDDERRMKAKVVLESFSFDGFAVVWTPSVAGVAEASVCVRFNFLSTDFSHSKGVKGIPVRLCAKTEILYPDSASTHSELPPPEVSYCKVKLFRDHGAERKLSNDIIHVKKSIEKMRQQAAQAQVEGTGMKIFGKKTKKEDDSGKPGKAVKHKRTWSMSSVTSISGSQDEDVSIKLKIMQDMFTSTRPVSVFNLRGDDSDDPDMYPIQLPVDGGGIDSWAVHRRASVATTNTTASSAVSPSPSVLSHSSRRCCSYSPEKEWDKSGLHANQNEPPVRVKTTGEDGLLSGWIEAVGIDPLYKPPAEKLKKAVMCVYILPVIPNVPENGSYYRAVYLQTRSASCLSNSIAFKCGVDPSTIYRAVYLNSKGLSILLDDDLVAEMNEGQDMKVQLREILDDGFLSPQDGCYKNGNNADANVGNKWELQLLF